MNPLKALKHIKHRAYIAQRQLNLYQEARSIRQSASFKAKYASLDHTFMLSPLPRVKGIWGIAMVKNEADIIELAVKHLLDQGVDQLLIVDNGSTDRTLDILHGLAQSYPLSVGTDAEPAYYQSEKMTWLADQAKEHGATWIIPFDADEFWFGTTLGLAQALAQAKAPIVEAPIYNQFPQPDGGWKLDPIPHREAKICFKPNRPYVIAMGNHSLIGPGKISKSKIAILHRPWRSFDQFSQKIRQGSAALKLTDLPEELGYHWRALGHISDTELHTIWSELTQGGQVPEHLAWRPHGPLVPMKSPLPRHWSELPLSPA